MACDHLDKKTFSNAMSAIADEYYNISIEFNNGFKEAINAYYDGWKSVKGYKHISYLLKNISAILDTASEKIVNNYNTMKEGGEAYAFSQEMGITISDITKKDFGFFSDKLYTEDMEIIIDEDKIGTANELMRTSLEKINKYVDNSKVHTESDQTFGYYSTDSYNPRVSIHNAYTSIENGLRTVTSNFHKEFEKILEEDKAERDAKKHASAVDGSDFTDIF